jgi:hypothetical protein
MELADRLGFDGVVTVAGVSDTTMRGVAPASAEARR